MPVRGTWAGLYHECRLVRKPGHRWKQDAHVSCTARRPGPETRFNLMFYQKCCALNVWTHNDQVSTVKDVACHLVRKRAHVLVREPFSISCSLERADRETRWDQRADHVVGSLCSRLWLCSFCLRHATICLANRSALLNQGPFPALDGRHTEPAP